jgi:L-amino acid N-acyltransferase YncA
MINIRKLLPQDWEDVERIYVQGIHTGQATFQSESPGWEEWDQGHLPDLRYVAVEDNVIAGGLRYRLFRDALYIQVWLK